MDADTVMVECVPKSVDNNNNAAVIDIVGARVGIKIC